MDKYLLTLSYRRDGTSRFSEDNRWGNFPAAAFAWKMSEEDFLKDSDVISNLKTKIRMGYYRSTRYSCFLCLFRKICNW